MKAIIEEVFLPATYKANGLPGIQFSGLKEIVALTGPNGAGKSRILEKIDGIGNSDARRLQLEKEIVSWKSAVASERNTSSASRYSKELKSREDEFQTLPVMSPAKAPLHTVSFPGYSVTLGKTSDMNDGQFQNLANRAHSLGSSAGDPASAAQILAAIHRSYVASDSKHALISAEQKAKAEKRFRALEDIVRIFLQTEITLTENFQTHIFSLPIDKAKLSSGQTRLLHFCIALFEHVANDTPMIVLLDEPENHLHPEALILLVDRLRSALSNGQLWIATHSVPLLAHVGQEYIWVVKGGQVERAGRKTREVLTTLMGGENNIERLAAFLQEPLLLAANTFAWESLSPPLVAPHKNGDPQETQVLSDLNLRSGNGAIRLLDFGAGKGRLIEAIAASSDEQSLRIEEAADYVAYDAYSKDRAICEAAIARAYGSSVGRYISKEADLHACAAIKPFDKIVMCNALHEIDPAEWPAIFSDFSSLLDSAGELLIVEDLEIPHGELAHPNGFVLLDLNAVRYLFGISGSGNEVSLVIHQEKKYVERLAGYSIKKSALRNVTLDTVRSSLDWTHKQSLRKIDDLRKSGDTSYLAGLRHALYCQQVVNTELLLKRYPPA